MHSYISATAVSTLRDWRNAVRPAKPASPSDMAAVALPPKSVYERLVGMLATSNVKSALKITAALCCLLSLLWSPSSRQFWNGAPWTLGLAETGRIRCSHSHGASAAGFDAVLWAVGPELDRPAFVRAIYTVSALILAGGQSSVSWQALCSASSGGASEAPTSACPACSSRVSDSICRHR